MFFVYEKIMSDRKPVLSGFIFVCVGFLLGYKLYKMSVSVSSFQR